MNTFISYFKKISFIISGIIISGILTSCQTNSLKENDMFGEYNHVPLKMSDLTPQEKSSLSNAQKQLYDTAQKIIENHYLEAWFLNYQLKNKFSSLGTAKKDYFDKNALVSKKDVDAFLAENANNKELLQIPEYQRSPTVKRYLIKVGQARAEDLILKEAYRQGLISLSAFQKPYEQIVQFEEGGHSLFPNLKSPKITIVEFADYQCPFCVKSNPDIMGVVASYPGKIQYIFRDFPLLDKHIQALPAALAAKCSENQGDYWGMHAFIFNRAPLDDLKPEMYLSFAEKLKLDVPKFKACLNDPVEKETILADLNEGLRVGVNETPTLFINGQKFEGYINADNLKAALAPLLQ